MAAHGQAQRLVSSAPPFWATDTATLAPYEDCFYRPNVIIEDCMAGSLLPHGVRLYHQERREYRRSEVRALRSKLSPLPAWFH